MAISPARRGISLILPRVKHGAGLLRRTAKYVSLLRISEALHLALFEQPGKDNFLNTLSLPRPPQLRDGKGEGGSCEKITLYCLPGENRGPDYFNPLKTLDSGWSLFR
jgi:hypothetical protein